MRWWPSRRWRSPDCRKRLMITSPLLARSRACWQTTKKFKVAHSQSLMRSGSRRRRVEVHLRSSSMDWVLLMRPLSYVFMHFSNILFFYLFCDVLDTFLVVCRLSPTIFLGDCALDTIFCVYYGCSCNTPPQ